MKSIRSAYPPAKPKQINYWLLLVTLAGSTVAVILGLVIGRWLPEAKAEVSGPVLPATGAQSVGAADRVNLEASLANSQSNIQVVNGITVSASNPRIDDDKLSVDVCFTLPDDSNWIIWKASLKTADTIVSDFAATPIELRLPPVNGQQRVITQDALGNPSERTEVVTGDRKGRRCDTLSFQVSGGSNAYTAGLTVNSIAALPAEGQYCAYLEKVQKQLDARNVSIVVSCAEKEGSANAVVSKPASMSQADAEKLVYSDEWFTQIGPWVFDLSTSK
jgi:hypothetical protein